MSGTEVFLILQDFGDDEGAPLGTAFLLPLRPPSCHIAFSVVFPWHEEAPGRAMSELISAWNQRSLNWGERDKYAQIDFIWVQFIKWLPPVIHVFAIVQLLPLGSLQDWPTEMRTTCFFAATHD